MSYDEILINSAIRTIPNWPEPGVNFRDIAPLFAQPKITRMLIDAFVQRYIDVDFSHFAAIDARGFLIGSNLAYALNKPLVLIRKAGKLPGKVDSESYSSEYSSCTLEVQENSFSDGDQVVLVDDLIATGGTLLAAQQLIKKQGADIVEAVSIINLPSLGGSQKLMEAGIASYSLVAYDN